MEYLTDQALVEYAKSLFEYRDRKRLGRNSNWLTETFSELRLFLRLACIHEIGDQNLGVAAARLAENWFVQYVSNHLYCGVRSPAEFRESLWGQQSPCSWLLTSARNIVRKPENYVLYADSEESMEFLLTGLREIKTGQPRGRCWLSSKRKSREHCGARCDVLFLVQMGIAWSEETAAAHIEGELRAEADQPEKVSYSKSSFHRHVEECLRIHGDQTITSISR